MPLQRAPRVVVLASLYIFQLVPVFTPTWFLKLPTSSSLARTALCGYRSGANIYSDVNYRAFVFCRARDGHLFSPHFFFRRIHHFFHCTACQVRGSVLFNTAGGLVSFRESELPFYMLPVMWFFNNVVGFIAAAWKLYVGAFAGLRA